MSNDNQQNNSFTNLQEHVFKEFVEDKITKLTSFVQENDDIHSLLAIGSLGNRTMRKYSNLNLILVTKLKTFELYEHIRKIFSNDLQFSLQKSNKLLYYISFVSDLENRTFEIDIKIIDKIENTRELFIGSRFQIDDLATIILVDKNDFIRKDLLALLNENKIFKDEIPSYIVSTANNFIEFFVKGCMNLNKTDLYQYYFNMSRAYSELIKLETIHQNNLEDLANPIFALARMNLFTDFTYFRKITPNIYQSDKIFKTEYVRKFVLLMRELKGYYSFEFDIAGAEHLITNLLAEIQFWNLRDISYLDLQHLRKGVFFRSSALSRYDDQEELINFLSDNNIKTIIDLRTKEEYRTVPYQNIDKNITYVNIPIGKKDTIDSEKMKYSKPEKPEGFYELFLRFYQEEIKEIFNKIANNQPGIVLHCHAGRDRTGIITGLLLDLLGEKSEVINTELITEDYLNSGDNTDNLAFDIFKKTLKEFGGSKNYLQKIGLSNISIDNIFKKFIL